MKHLMLVSAVALCLAITNAASAAPGGSQAKGKKASEKVTSVERQRGKDKASERHREDRDDWEQEAETEKGKGSELRQSKMNQKAIDAQNRNKASRQMKEDYRASVKSGETERLKGKKPWWKFWNSEAE